jgi:hypothetical protein
MSATRAPATKITLFSNKEVTNKERALVLVPYF